MFYIIVLNKESLFVEVFWFLKYAPLKCIENSPLGEKKFSIFGDPSLLTGAIAKMEDTTIHLDKSRWKNRAQGLKK